MFLDNLSKLQSCLSEILFIYGLLGLGIWLFEEYRRRKFRNLCFVLMILVFMLGWRFQMHLKSSRYLSILLIPAMIFAVWLLYHSRLKRFWGRIFLAVFVLYGILKVCPDKSKYHELSALTRVIAEEKLDCKAVYDLTRENSRLRYLFKKSGLDPKILIDCSTFSKNQLLRRLEQETYFSKKFCVIVKDSEKSPPLLSSNDMKSFVRSVKIIAEIPSRVSHHSAVYRIFSITSLDSRVLPSQDVVRFAQTHPQYRLPNGNFQQCLSPNESRERAKRFANAGFKFFAGHSYVWPTGWAINFYLPSSEKESFKAFRNERSEMVIGSFYSIELRCMSNLALAEDQIAAIQLRPLSDCKVNCSLYILPLISKEERMNISGGRETQLSKKDKMSWYINYLRVPPSGTRRRQIYFIFRVHEGDVALSQVYMFPVSKFRTWQQKEGQKQSHESGMETENSEEIPGLF